MDLFSFNPPHRGVIVGRKSYELEPLSIGILVQLQQDFGRLEVFQEAINQGQKNVYDEKYAGAVSGLAYILLKDKSDFKDLAGFRSKLFKAKPERYLACVGVINQVIGDSQPIRASEELVKTPDDGLDHFSRSYVLVAKAIGCSIEEFYGLTLRQINQIQEDVMYLKNLDREFEAAIHGAKLKKQATTASQFSEEDTAALDDFSKRRLEQMKNGNHNFTA